MSDVLQPTLEFHRDNMRRAIAAYEALPEMVAMRERAALYNELLYSVETKFPDETRHETALRYIQNAEKPSSNVAQGTAISDLRYDQSAT
jgi:hypothetical protein